MKKSIGIVLGVLLVISLMVNAWFLTQMDGLQLKLTSVESEAENYKVEAMLQQQEAIKQAAIAKANAVEADRQRAIASEKCK